MNVEKNNPLWFMGVSNPRSIGYYSQTSRNFQNELENEEPNHNTPLEMFLPDDPDSIYNDEDFSSETKEMWDKFVRNAEEDFSKLSQLCFIAQSHIDIAWKWRLGQSIRKVEATYGCAVKHMDLFQNFCFAGSQPVLYEMLEKINPSLFEQVAARVKEGRFEITGACWTEPDPRMPSGEAFARQHLYGQRYYLRKFGKISEIAWFQDSFGYSVQMPQYSVRSGCKYYFTNKIASNKDTVFPTNAFHWFSPDGSHMLSYWAPGGFSLFNTWQKFKKGHRMLKAGEHFAFDYSYDKPESSDKWSDEIIPVIGFFYGKGDGGHGPTGEEWAWVRKFQEYGNVTPKRAIDFYRDLEKVGNRLPEFHDELYYEFHRATLTTHHLVKYMNRRMEWCLQGLDSLASIVFIQGYYRYPYEKLTRLWKNVCTLHMHDILPGSSIPEVYDDCWDLWQVFKQWTNEIQQEILDYFINELNLKVGASGLLLLNPLCVERNGLIEIPWEVSLPIPKGIIQDNNFSPIQLISADPDTFEPLERKCSHLIFSGHLKPWEICTIQFSSIIPSESASSKVSIQEKNDEYFIESEYYQIILRKSNGAIISLKLHKKSLSNSSESPIETLAGPSNVVEGFEDFLLGEPAWNFNPTYRKTPLESDCITRSPLRIVDTGPVRWTFENAISFKTEENGWANITQRLSVYADCEGIDLETLIDWKMNEVSVKNFFVIAGDPQISISEVAYGTIKRSLYPKANHDKPRWENNMQSFLTIPAKDNSFCFNIINEGKYGFDNIEGNKIGISMIRGPRYPDVPPSSWVSKERADRKKRDGTEPFDVADHGSHIIRLRLMPKVGNWENQAIEQVAHAYNCPVLSKVIDYKPYSQWYTLDLPKGIEIACIKIGEEGNEQSEDWNNPKFNLNTKIIVLRVYETVGQDQNVKIPIPEWWGIKQAQIADLIERPTTEPLETQKTELGAINMMECHFAPHEIKTFLLSRS
jgi:alpha-mannosidase